MNNEGMVAVVRGTKDAGIRVTLLDGTRQYTLQPNNCAASPAGQSVNTSTQYPQYAAGVESGAQAIDGRYATVYQTVHCNMVPTSPAVGVSEFPPQKAALSKGHGNFEIGGLGSGETTFRPLKDNESFRGGLNWPDRGAVFSPRPSVVPNPFANSLRKYPVSPERSTEIVERLINYAQFRNSKTQKFPAQRAECQTRSRKTPDIDIRTDESPTRERSRKYEETDRYERPRRYDDDRSRRYDEGDRRFDRSYDVRNLRDILRRGREIIRNNPFVRPVCPTIKEKYVEQLPEVQISIDTQVEIPKTSSKAISTVPRPNPTVRNVAIPMSPLPSSFALPTYKKTSKSIQTLRAQEITLLPIKSAQTCFSSIDITNKKIINVRKSKSQEGLNNDNFDDEVLQLVHDLEDRGSFRDELLKKLKNIFKADKSDRESFEFDSFVKDQLFSEVELKEFTKELSCRLLCKIKKSFGLFQSLTSLHRAEIQSVPHRENDVICIDDVIDEWLRDIPIKSRDCLGKSIKKDNLLLTIAKKIKSTVVSNFKLDNEKSMKTEIMQVFEDVPIALDGCDKRLYLNRLATDLVRRIKEIMLMFTYKVEKFNADNKNNINVAISKNSTSKEEEIKCYVQEELAHFVRKFHLNLCPASMEELENELIDIILVSNDTIRSGNEDKVKEDILSTLFDLLNITEYQANVFANNMIVNMKKILSDVPKVRLQTFIELDKQRVNNTNSLIDGVIEHDIKANLVWYTNQIIQQINKWVSSLGLDLNDSFTKQVIHDLAGDIVDRHKYLELSPTTKASEIGEIEHLKYQIFKWINKLVGYDNLETIEKAPELMQKIRSIPVPMLVKSHKTTQEYCQNNYNNKPCSTRTSITVGYNQGIARSNVTVAIGSVCCCKASPSDNEESRIEHMPSSQAVNKYKTFVTLPILNKSDPARSSASKNRPTHRSNNNKTAEQKTQDQIIEEFDQFLKGWVQRIPISEKPELIAKCRQGIYNGIWKAISKIKMNPETIDNPLYYKDVLDDEIEELLNCLTQTPELKKQRNNLKAEIIEKAAKINAHVDPAALNTSYKQQLDESVLHNLPKVVNRVDHADQDLNKVYEEVMKLHLAEYFILYTKYKEDNAIKANVFKRKLLQEVHELVEGVKQTHGKELRDIEIKQYVEGVIHALQNVPVPNDETLNLESDEIILALEVEQWFSDLPLMPNNERMDVLSRRKYRDVLAKKLFDLDNSNGGGNDGQMREEIIKFLNRMPFRPGEAENMHFMVEELMVRIKNRPKDVDGDNKKALAFVEPHGYEAFSRDMPLCSSYTDNQNGSSYLIIGGERAADRSMAYGGQYVQNRNDPGSQQKWLSLEQSASPEAMRDFLQNNGPSSGQPIEAKIPADRSMPYGGQNVQGTNDPGSQQKWLSLEQSASPEAMRDFLQNNGPSSGQPIEAKRPADRSMPYGGQNVQETNDPGSQQKWLSSEQSAAQGAMRSCLLCDGPCCRKSREAKRPADRSMPDGSQNIQGTNDPGSQKEWLSLEQTTSPEAMKGFLQNDGPTSGHPIEAKRPADRSMPYGGQNVQGTNDPGSQQKWLSLEQSASPEAMRDFLRNDGQSSGQPIEAKRPADRSLPYGGQNVQGTNDPGSQQERLSLEQSTSPVAMRGVLRNDDPSSGQSIEAKRPADRSMPYGGQNVQGTNDPGSQQQWLSLEKSTSPAAMRGSLRNDGQSNGQPIGAKRPADRSMPYGGQNDQGTNDPGSQQERLSLEKSTYPVAIRGVLRNDDPSSGQPIEAKRPADRSMPYGGQNVQGTNDPGSQQKWLSLEQSASPEAMRGSLRNDGQSSGQPIEAKRPADRSIPYGGQNVQGTNDPGSQQQWLPLEKSTSPADMRGSLRNDGQSSGQPIEAKRPADRSMPYGGQNVQGTNDPGSQQERLSLEKSTSPAAMRGSLHGASQNTSTRGCTSLPAPQQGADPCCRRPCCMQSTSSPRRHSLPGAPQQSAGPYCGRPDCAQKPTLSPREPTQQKWLSPNQLKAPLNIRHSISFAPQESTSATKRASGPSQSSTSSQTYRSMQIIDTSERGTGASREYSPPRTLSNTRPTSGNISSEQSKATASKGQLPASSLSDDGPVTREQSKTAASKGQLPASSLSDDGPVTKEQSKTAASKGQLPASSLSDDGPVTREQSQTAASRSQLPASSLSDDGPVTREQSKMAASRGQLPASSLSDDGPVTREQSQTAASRGQLQASSLSDDEPVTRKQSKTAASRGQLPASSLSDDESVTREQSKTAATRGQLPASSLSDDEPVTEEKQKKNKPKRAPKVKCGCYETGHNLSSESTNTVSRGQSPARDTDDKFVTARTETPKTGSPTTCTRPGRSHYDEEFNGRPVRHSSQQGTIGSSNKCRCKKKSKDIEEERRKETRRRTSIEENSDESDRDDLKCRCMERVWKWGRRRKCKPCDDHPDMDFMYLPFPMYPPPSYYY